MKANPSLERLSRLVGTWNTAGMHPYLPGRKLRGQASFEWIEDGAFFLMRTSMDATEIPAGVAIFGSDDTDGMVFMLYYDERGVSRKFDIVFDESGLTWSREDPSFSQRFRITIARDGRTMEGRGEMSKAGSAWEADLALTYALKLGPR